MARSPAKRALREAGDFAVAQALFGVTRLVGAMPIDRALDAAHAIGVRLGPRASRNRLVLDSLARALPELTDAQRERVAAEMWGHQARLVIETAYSQRLFDYAPGAPAGRVEVSGAALLDERRDAGRPTLFFTAHTGCFEFLPAICRAHGYPTATLFRAPNNRRIAARLVAQRVGTNGLLVSAGRGAAATLHGELAGGRGVGVLVDQKFRAGPRVPFFGQPAPTNPLVAKLSRQTDGEVVPARCVRLPGNCYRIEIGPPMTLPRTASGEVDVPAGLAAINTIVEGWVREHPEQWMWFHRRWG